jgi:hypothetical protein
MIRERVQNLNVLHLPSIHSQKYGNGLEKIQMDFSIYSRNYIGTDLESLVGLTNKKNSLIAALLTGVDPYRRRICIIESVLVVYGSLIASKS